MCGKAKRTGQIRRGAGSVKTLGSTPGCMADLFDVINLLLAALMLVVEADGTSKIVLPP